ncbi:unnamed protein product [Symbiodinium sp. CCMP2592]|nr:unnamed protein product [Symbiodinium sp. CCMP2592]
MAKQRFLVFALSLVLAARARERAPERPQARSVWKDLDVANAEGVSERCPPGVSLLQSSAKRPGPGHADRREHAEEIGKIPESIPFASLVESSAPSHPVMLNQIKQVVELAQTRVQTKVGEAPYFIIAVAIGGFLLSLLSICMSLVFVERGLSKDGDVYAEPSASALLSQRLRALGLGDARSYRASTRAERSEMNPARTWEHGNHQGSKKPMVMADGQRRLQIVVQQPLEGGRVGLNLAEDDLVVNNFGDLRAYDLGFRVGDRLLQVNQVPVFRESDFKFVMQDALRRNSERGEPLVFHVLRRGGGAGVGEGPAGPGGPPGGPAGARSRSPFLGSDPPIGGSARAQMPAPAPEMNGDLRGSWCYGDTRTDDLYTYEIRQVGKDLGFEQALPNGEKITGLLIPDGLWLRSDLQSKDGYYGEIRLQYDPEEQVLVSQLKKGQGDAWSDDILARRAR